MDLKQTVFSLTGAVGTSGRETQAADVAMEKLSKYCTDAHIDVNGNVIGTLGSGDKNILIEAHIDQIGMVVTAVTDDGFVKVAKSGGVDIRTLAAQEVTIWGKEAVTGVVSSTPPHLAGSDDDGKAIAIDSVAIDTGLTGEQARSRISLGDSVTVNSKQLELMNGRIASPCLDDRAGVAVLLRALELLEGKALKNKVTVAFTTQEEVGQRGARTAAFACGADKAISVDVSFALTPDADKSECGELGKGPMIGVSPFLSKKMSDNFTSICGKNDIPYQTEVMGSATGTNADVIGISGVGVETGLISIPLRYMHTGVEVIDTADLENCARLIALYLEGGAC